MDTIIHLLVGLILAFAFFNDRQKVERIVTVSLSIAPDLALSTFTFVKDCNSWFSCNIYPSWIWFPYAVSHSIITFIVLGSICYVFLRRWFLPFILGWGSAHILIDLLTHSGQYGIRFLYPFSSTVFPGFGLWTEHTAALPGIWICLLVLLGIVIVVNDEKKQKKKAKKRKLRK